MDKARRKALEAAGWRFGSAEEFLDLSEKEAEFVELKLALSRELKHRRVEHGLSQLELAARLGSSQSRVAKMEASDPTVSVDLLIRGILATGASKEEIGKSIARPVVGRRASGRRPEATSDTIGLPRRRAARASALRDTPPSRRTRKAAKTSAAGRRQS